MVSSRRWLSMTVCTDAFLCFNERCRALIGMHGELSRSRTDALGAL